MPFYTILLLTARKESKMKLSKKLTSFVNMAAAITVLCTILVNAPSAKADLPEVKKSGVLRHLGVPYANFVTGSGDGLSVDLIKMFAKHLGVRYQYVKTTWEDVISDLNGKKVQLTGDKVKIVGSTPVRGDLIANGLTILPWRQRFIDYSVPTFPTQVWLVALATSPLKPIKPSGNTEKDIKAVKSMLKGISVLGKRKTCLDPSLYSLNKTGAKIKLFKGNVNDLVPALMKGEAQATLLDIADAIIALEKWPGKIKVIGPVSPMQKMGVGFAKTSPLLRKAFNKFFKECKENGIYQKLVEKYYPNISLYYPDFFR